MTFARLPAPPYYIVTFSSIRTEGGNDPSGGYGEMADRMEALAAQQVGYLGAESVRSPDGFGITNSYWTDELSIRNWKRQVDHMVAQKTGRQDWYARYEVRIGRIERAYGFERPKD